MDIMELLQQLFGGGFGQPQGRVGMGSGGLRTTGTGFQQANIPGLQAPGASGPMGVNRGDLPRLGGRTSPPTDFQQANIPGHNFSPTNGASGVNRSPFSPQPDFQQAGIPGLMGFLQGNAVPQSPGPRPNPQGSRTPRVASRV